METWEAMTSRNYEFFPTPIFQYLECGSVDVLRFFPLYVVVVFFFFFNLKRHTDMYSSNSHLSRLDRCL